MLKNNSGMSLAEVMIASAILSIVLMMFGEGLVVTERIMSLARNREMTEFAVEKLVLEGEAYLRDEYVDLDIALMNEKYPEVICSEEDTIFVTLDGESLEFNGFGLTASASDKEDHEAVLSYFVLGAR